jgi:4-amino-4-deoxy-L-arabinose transferase-like glycosyltransferase
MRRFALLFLLLFAFALRLWALDAKGLAYDEAATALMARATPAAIIDFHWRAAFEHPPFWQLIMHYWSLGLGQSEVALRLLPVFAGVVALPLVWQLARRFGVGSGAALAAVLLTATAPVLVYYSQEARMYTLVAAFALASVLLTQQLATTPTAGTVALYLLINWIMMGLHYYSVLLIGAEGCFLLGWLIWQRLPFRHWLWHGVALSLTLAPLALWMTFAPGFRDTATIVLGGSGGLQPTPLQFVDALWRDLTFAAIRWGSTAAVLGYLLLPLLVIGFVALVQPIPRSASVHKQRGLLLLLVCLLPVVASLLISRTLATRYLLYIMPPLLVVIAAGIGWLGRLHWSLGLTALAVALTPSALALPQYFGPYQKSAYREMTVYLTTHRQPDEALLLEGPRQHLLAKYYLPAEKTPLTAPVIALPDYWPVNAPPVVPEEMDDYLRQALVDHRGLWLSLTAENEVDPGEFVPKFLTAIAFQRECYGWLDVRLCHFVSPHFVEPQVQSQPAALFNGEMLLQATAVTLRPARLDEPAYLLTTLTWLAQSKPIIDYRVTLRLLDDAGAVVSQRDSFPIGPLLPPSTWNAGDAKPGYLALPLPTTTAPGTYQLAVNLYDPATLAPIRYERLSESATDAPLIVAKLTIHDTIEFTRQ